ncbi:MAG: hypothetical protein E7549_02355 [Ruminococcaceae bacterium]|nr:hypothetical protein [Oscillospiraceae bacterium]
MLYQNLDIHGAVELHEVEGGVMPYRLPREVYEVHPHLMEHTKCMVGMELRFVPEGEVKLTLSARGSNYATVFYGGLQSGEPLQHITIPSTPTTFTFNPPKMAKHTAHLTELYNLPYAHNVVRILLGNAPVIVHAIEGPCRPPQADEVPQKTGIFYGSSITQGACLASNILLWSRRVAEALGCDHFNHGVAGNCKLEKEFADWFAARNDWDFAVLELGINMVDHYDPEDFRGRVRYMLESMHNTHPDAYLFCIDVFCYRGDLFNENMAPPFRRVLEEEIARIGSDRIVHIPGLDILPNGAGLVTDIVHPGVEGVIEIARNLTAKLKPYFA